MRKLLFLDFDGVLHPTTCAPERYFGSVGVLATALSGEPCDLVISSSWRHHHDHGSLVDMFPESLRARFIGATGSPWFGRWPRYQEILAFADQIPGPIEWRALDDSRHEFPPGCPELIACDPNSGMGCRQAIALSAWLQH